jgi:serine/threonine protein kinase
MIVYMQDKAGREVRTLKIIDFGLAKLVRRAEMDARGRPLGRYKMTGETGSPRYMAPECHLNMPYNEKVDVYRSVTAQAFSAT